MSRSSHPASIPHLTLGRLTVAQLRSLVDGRFVAAGIAAVLVVAAVSGLLAGIAGLSDENGIHPLSVVTSALGSAAMAVQLFAIVCGAEAIAGEFARGTIRAWLAISPRRGVFFAAKALSLGLVAMALGLLSGILAAGVALLVSALAGHALTALIVGASLLAVGGLTLGTGILSLLVLSLGALTRQRLVALLIPIVALYIAPQMVQFLPHEAQNIVDMVLPSSAFAALTSVNASLSSSLWALLGLAAWCAVIVPRSAVVFVNGDVSPTSVKRSRPPRRMRALDQARRDGHRSTPLGRVRSELLKTWTLRPTWAIFALVTVLELGFGLARVVPQVHSGSAGTEHVLVEYSYAITGGVGGVALLLAALCAIQIAGEFETGTAISTYISAPRRWQVTSSKLAVAAVSGISLPLPGLVLTALIALAVFASHGFSAVPEAFAAGAITVAKALAFLLLTTAMSAGIAGFLRRSGATVITVIVLLLLGPAMLNTVSGFAASTGSPLIVIGNAARLLPWEGARFLYPSDEIVPFAVLDEHGRLQVSAQFGLVVTTIWALVALVAWLLTDLRRSIRVRNS